MQLGTALPTTAPASWNGGTTPLPDTRDAEPTRVGDLLVRHPAVGDWAPAHDTVLPLLPATRPSIDGTSFPSVDSALSAARLLSLGADRPAVAVQHSYANDPTRRVFRLVELTAPSDFGVVAPLHVEHGHTTVNANSGAVLDARFSDAIVAIVDGDFQLVSSGA